MTFVSPDLGSSHCSQSSHCFLNLALNNSDLKLGKLVQVKQLVQGQQGAALPGLEMLTGTPRLSLVGWQAVSRKNLKTLATLQLRPGDCGSVTHWQL
jgi:hypothetical protein